MKKRNRMMKCLSAWLLLIGILVTLAACGSDSGDYRQVYPPATEAQTETHAAETKAEPAEATAEAVTTKAPTETAAPQTEAPTETAAPQTEALAETAAPQTEAPTETVAPQTEASTETVAPQTEEPTDPAPETEEVGDRAHVHAEGDPTEATDAVITYVLNKNTMKYHLPTCSSVGDIKPENRENFYGTKEEAEAMGYVACKRCKP